MKEKAFVNVFCRRVFMKTLCAYIVQQIEYLMDVKIGEIVYILNFYTPTHTYDFVIVSANRIENLRLR